MIKGSRNNNLAFWLVLLHANFVKNTRHSDAMPVFFALLAHKITLPILPTYYFVNPKWLAILFVLPFTVQAQEVILNLHAPQPVELKGGFDLFFPEHTNEYLVPQWSKGKLFYTNGTSKTYDSLNFNRHQNMMEVVVNNKVLTLMPLGLAGGLIYNSNYSGSVLIVGIVNAEAKFLVVNSVGKHLLASYLTTKIEEVRRHKTDEMRFVPKEEGDKIIKEAFVIFSNGSWEEFKISKSLLSKFFNTDKKELQSFATDAGISMNDKVGLIRLFQLLNK